MIALIIIAIVVTNLLSIIITRHIVTNNLCKNGKILTGKDAERFIKRMKKQSQ